MVGLMWLPVTSFSGAVTNTVRFSDFTESSGTDATPLFHAPTVSGDTLNFDPVFTAYANGSGGNASDTTEGQLGFEVSAAGDHVIRKVQITERGDYNMLSFGNSALVDVTATLFVEVLEVDGKALASPVNGTAQMSFDPKADGQFLLSSFGTDSGLWIGSLIVDLDALLADNSISYVNGATRVNLELGNTVQALAQTDTEAFIANKDLQVFALSSNISSIPEPASLELLFGITSLLAFIRHRRCG
jgi:hypothetical protein